MQDSKLTIKQGFESALDLLETDASERPIGPDLARSLAQAFEMAHKLLISSENLIMNHG
jgi:retron-type reverse transcriptase